MSQFSLLAADGIIEELESDHSEDTLFLQFKKAATYQVNVSLIEELSGLKFQDAKDSYTDDRPKELVFKEINIDPELESDSLEQQLGFYIENIVL